MTNKEKELETLLELEKETREAMLNMLEDMADQKNMIEHSHQEWKNAFDTIGDAMMLHDKDHNIMRVNKAYKELSGAEKYKHIIGKPYFDVFPKLAKPMKSCLESTQTGEEVREEFTTEDGRTYLSRTYPVLDENSNYSYGIHIFQDVTNEHAQEKKIENLNKTLRLISRCNEILVRSIDENELVTTVMGEIIKHSSYDFVGVYYKGEDKTTCYEYRFSEDEMLKLKTVDISKEKYQDCPVNVCIEKRRVINIENIKADEEWTEILHRSKDICPASLYGMKGSILLLPLSNSESLGAMVIYSKRPQTFSSDQVELFIELSEDTAYGIHTLRLREKFVQTSQHRDETLKKLKESLDGTVKAVASMVEARDPYTAGHQTRASALAVAIAQELGLDKEQIEGIKVAGQVHDIGKIQIPSELLTKPTKLTDIEYQLIQTHPQTGYEIVKNIHFPWKIADIILQHHEAIDGSGYPNGLKEDDILLEAKIISVSDVVEAIASHRPYRAALGVDYALNYIEENKGVLYDTEVVDACLKLFREKNYILPKVSTSLL